LNEANGLNFYKQLTAGSDFFHEQGLPLEVGHFMAFLYDANHSPQFVKVINLRILGAYASCIAVIS
jgi:hypothetical protein